MEIQTGRLRLVLQTLDEVLAGIEAMSPAERAEVSPEWWKMIRSSTSPDAWTHGFAIVDKTSLAIVGSCGYKGPPGSERTVEIAYGIDPPYQGQGYATKAAGALVAYAFQSGQVRRVRAHTRPGPNASTRVLEKCGFAWVGEVADPEDGLVWRWEMEGE